MNSTVSTLPTPASPGRSPIGYAAAGAGLILLTLLLMRITRPGSMSEAMTGAIEASLVIALMTGVGALPALFIRDWTTGLRDSLMGFSAGVMLGATIFTLLLPALGHAESLWGNVQGAALLAISVLAGAMLLWLADALTPHQHLVTGRCGPDTGRVRGVWLVVLAMALHHLPEGFAVGASFGHSQATGMAIAIGIGIQSLPEGLVVAAALLSVGYTRAAALGVAILTGLTQPLGATLGAWLAGLTDTLLPIMLAGAAGAMLFVVSHEIIPESHRDGNEGVATAALMGGFVLMLLLIAVLD